MAVTEEVVIKVSERGVRDVKDYIRGLGDEAAKSADKTDKVEDAVERVGKRSKDVNLVTDALTRLAFQAGSAIGALVGLSKSFGAALDVDRALAEVNTLLPTTGDQLAFVDEQARQMAITFGSTATEQVKAFYDILSAGAADAYEANETLAEANELAVAGVTSVGSAVNLLTSSVNAYGKEVLSMGQASDIAFLAVKLGKTTVDELASSLGRVTPIAASVGVSFAEVNGAIAAVTATGIQTSEAVSGLKAVFDNVLKPSTDAAKAARQYGIDLSIAGLQSKGFAGFMQEVITKTGGSEAALTRLFGSTEALNIAFALTKNEGAAFNNIMAQMANAAGTTDVAFNKVAESASFKWNQAVAAGTEIGIRFGNVLLTVAAPALGFFADNIDLIINLLPALATGMLFAFGPSIIGAINAVRNAFFLFNAVVIANPIGLFATAAVALVGILYTYSDAIIAALTPTGWFGEIISTVVDWIDKFFAALAELIGISNALGAEMELLTNSEKQLADAMARAKVEAEKQAQAFGLAGNAAGAAAPKVSALASAMKSLPSPTNDATAAASGFGDTTAAASLQASNALAAMASKGSSSYAQLAQAAFNAARNIKSAANSISSSSGSMFSNLTGSSMFGAGSGNMTVSVNLKDQYLKENPAFAQFNDQWGDLLKFVIGNNQNYAMRPEYFQTSPVTSAAYGYAWTPEAEAMFKQYFTDYNAALNSMKGQLDADTRNRLDKFSEILFENGKLDLSSADRANEFLANNKDLAPFIQDILADLFGRGFLNDKSATDYFDQYFRPDNQGNGSGGTGSSEREEYTSAYGGKYSFGEEPETKKTVNIEKIEIILPGVTDTASFKRSREQMIAQLKAELEALGE